MAVCIRGIIVRWVGGGTTGTEEPGVDLYSFPIQTLEKEAGGTRRPIPHRIRSGRSFRWQLQQDVLLRQKHTSDGTKCM